MKVRLVYVGFMNDDVLRDCFFILLIELNYMMDDIGIVIVVLMSYSWWV